ncbi:hypothetical protein LINPERPRIM_LOCUS4446, partial [Linum perenne]
VSGLDLLQGIEHCIFSSLGDSADLLWQHHNLRLYLCSAYEVVTSPQECAQDPIYHVLLRHDNKTRDEQKGKHFPVVSARIVFTILGCAIVATLVYTILTDGSPFRQELLTPWMCAMLIDFYVNIAALSVWVAYKETSWLSASACRIVLLAGNSFLNITSQYGFASTSYR